MPAFTVKKKEIPPELGPPPTSPEMDMSMPGQPEMPPPQQEQYEQQQPYYEPQAQDMGGQQMQPDMNSIPPPDMYQQPYAQPSFPSYPTEDTKERIEEIAEAIIDEKWNALIKDINKVVEWKERTDGDLKKIQQEIDDLKERFETLHKGILGKITEYDQNLTNVGTEIKAMDMAFQKILPTFTENVNKLDRIVKSTNR